MARCLSRRCTSDALPSAHSSITSSALAARVPLRLAYPSGDGGRTGHVALRVDLRHVGLAVSKQDLRGFQAEVPPDIRRVVVRKLMRVPVVGPPVFTYSGRVTLCLLRLVRQQ